MAADDETQDAKAYWSGIGVLPFYLQEGLQSDALVAAVGELSRKTDIHSVFEFGCNAGRNLDCLRRYLDPALRLHGVDINADAIAAGRDRFGLDLRVADEAFLAGVPDRSFDVCFTLSVLDHVGAPEAVRGILRHLTRIASKYVLLLEPFDGTNRRSGLEKASEHNYYWNYRDMLRELGKPLLNDVRCPLGRAPLVRDYRLFVVGIAPDLPALMPFFLQRLAAKRLLRLRR